MTSLVTDSAAGDDRIWFAEHPTRRYRLRQTNGDWWVIRRRASGVLLLARITTTIPRGLPDTDKALQAIWVAAAWACLDPVAQAALVKQIKHDERLHDL